MHALRTWRARVSTGDAGLPARSNRRVPGLRREELAQLAGVSVNYLTRLEQGRARNPSVQVLSALARALRLTHDEQQLLFVLAGHADPGSERMRRHVTPGVQRMLDRLDDVPVIVLDAAWTMVAWNPIAAALLGDPSSQAGRARNVIWNHFTGVPSRLVHADFELASFETEIVGDLRAAVGRYPADQSLASLRDDLLEVSSRFAELWHATPGAVRVTSTKVFEHPEVGRVTLDCDVLTLNGTDLRVVVYTTPTGSRDADTLALLGVVGLQTLSSSTGGAVAASTTPDGTGRTPPRASRPGGT